MVDRTLERQRTIIHLVDFLFDTSSREDLWSLRVFVWDHRLRATSHGDEDHDEDSLTNWRPEFQIISFLELTLVIIHFHYFPNGWRPNIFRLVTIFYAEIHINNRQAPFFRLCHFVD